MLRAYPKPAAFAAGLLAAGFMGASSAWAAPAPQHGGIVVVSEGHPVEFVATDTTVTFHLSDEDGSPLSTKGIAARAILRSNGKTLIVPLTSQPPNRLEGSLAAPLAAGNKVLLDAKLHGHKLQPRFER
jgi:hypothetical protein